MKLNMQRTSVTPSSKAKPLPHPPVARDPQVLMPESGNNSVSKGAVKIPVDTLTRRSVVPPWQK